MKTRPMIALSLFAILPMACQKGPSAPSQNNRGTIAISGTFAGTSKTLAKKSAMDPSRVATVVAFCGTRGFSMSKVTAGSFNIGLDRSQPSALLFMDSAGINLGYLSLGNGMESIPLNMADTGVSAIDLQSLTSSGNIVEPGHNPVGSEIPMTASDITSYVFSNGALGSVVKSPDVDGDGIVDVATGTFYRYTMRYAIRGGSFGSGLTPTLVSPIVINTYVFEVKIDDPDLDFPSQVSFNGPAGSGIESATSWLKQSFGTVGCSYCAPAISIPSIPPAGTYSVSYKTKTLTFELLSQAEITKCLAIPVPTVLLNSDSTIHKISIEYRLSDGSATIDPRALILDLNVQISVDVGNGAPGAQVYSSATVPPDTTEFVLTNQPLKWGSVLSVGTGYEDVFGNQIGVNWTRP